MLKSSCAFFSFSTSFSLKCTIGQKPCIKFSNLKQKSYRCTSFLATLPSRLPIDTKNIVKITHVTNETKRPCVQGGKERERCSYTQKKKCQPQRRFQRGLITNFQQVILSYLLGQLKKATNEQRVTKELPNLSGISKNKKLKSLMDHKEQVLIHQYILCARNLACITSLSHITLILG